MFCRTWEKLYEAYEKATLKRVTQRKQKLFLNHSQIDHLNGEIARALRELREHEQVHRCHS